MNSGIRVAGILVVTLAGASSGCSPSAETGTSPLGFSHVSRVEGRIVDASGTGIPGVSVQFLIDPARRVHDYANPPVITGEQGAYDLVVGRYAVSSPLPALDTVSGHLHFAGTGSNVPRQPGGALYVDSSFVTLRFSARSDPDAIARRVDTLRIP